MFQMNNKTTEEQDKSKLFMEGLRMLEKEGVQKSLKKSTEILSIHNNAICNLQMNNKTTDGRDKSKLLMERLRMLEKENSSLVLENEQQRQQYEKCLDEIANQVRVPTNLYMITLLFAPKCINP